MELEKRSDMQRAQRICEVLKVTRRDESIGSDSQQGSNFKHSIKKKSERVLKFTFSEGLAGIQGREIKMKSRRAPGKGEQNHL